MSSVIRKRFTPKFKAQAVELVGLGKPVPEVAEALGIGTGILSRRVGGKARSAEDLVGEGHGGDVSSQVGRAGRRIFPREKLSR